MAKDRNKDLGAELDALAKKRDEDIDTSDIPEVKDWSKAVRGKFYKKPEPTPEPQASGGSPKTKEDAWITQAALQEDGVMVGAGSPSVGASEGSEPLGRCTYWSTLHVKNWHCHDWRAEAAPAEPPAFYKDKTITELAAEQGVKPLVTGRELEMEGFDLELAEPEPPRGVPTNKIVCPECHRPMIESPSPAPSRCISEHSDLRCERDYHEQGNHYAYDAQRKLHQWVQWPPHRSPSPALRVLPSAEEWIKNNRASLYRILEKGGLLGAYARVMEAYAETCRSAHVFADRETLAKELENPARYFYAEQYGDEPMDLECVLFAARFAACQLTGYKTEAEEVAALGQQEGKS